MGHGEEGRTEWRRDLLLKGVLDIDWEQFIGKVIPIEVHVVFVPAPKSESGQGVGDPIRNS